MAIDLPKRLNEEIARHNELVEQRDQAQTTAQQAEQQRLIVRGRIEALNELVAEDEDEEPQEDDPEDARNDGQADPSGGDN